MRRRGGAAGFEFRERQQIGGDVAEPRGLRQDDFDKAPVVVPVFERAVEQRFGIAADGGERGSQFVRDVGDEIPADTLQAFEFGDVVQDGQRSAGGGRPKGPASTSKERAPAPGKRQPLFHALAGGEDAWS